VMGKTVLYNCSRNKFFQWWWKPYYI